MVGGVAFPAAWLQNAQAADDVYASSQLVSTGGAGASPASLELILADNRHFRVTGTISVEHIAEFVDRPTYGLIEVEPL